MTLSWPNAFLNGVSKLIVVDVEDLAVTTLIRLVWCNHSLKVFGGFGECGVSHAPRMAWSSRPGGGPSRGHVRPLPVASAH